MNESNLCPNCGSDRSGKYCAACGQKDQPLRQDTLYFLRQAFNEYFGIDGRLWKTLRLLLFRPGRLTEEHLKGRRSTYLAPLRIYLSATLLFFFLLSILDPIGAIEEKLVGSNRDSTATVTESLDAIAAELEDRAARRDSARQSVVFATDRLDSLRSAFSADSLSGMLADSVSMATFRSVLREAREEHEKSRESYDERLVDDEANSIRLEWKRSVLQSYPPDSLVRPADLEDASALLFPSESGGFDIDVFGASGPKNSALAKLADARTGTERRAALADFGRSVIDRLPLVLFLMLPVFALLMKVVYIRRGWYYSEHLIFALHNHALAFIGFTLMAVLVAIGNDSAWVSVGNLLIILLLNVYFLLAQKLVYGQGWFKTVLKFALVFASYWVMIVFFGFTVLLLLAAIVG